VVSEKSGLTNRCRNGNLATWYKACYVPLNEPAKTNGESNEIDIKPRVQVKRTTTYFHLKRIKDLAKHKGEQPRKSEQRETQSS